MKGLNGLVKMLWVVLFLAIASVGLSIFKDLRDLSCLPDSQLDGGR